MQFPTSNSDFLSPAYTSSFPDKPTNPDINSALGKARNLEKEGAYEEAYEAYHLLAMKHHDPEAQYRCGLMLLEGRGVPRHLAQAVYFLEAAARADYEDAALTLIAPRNRLTELRQAALTFGQSWKPPLPNTTLKLPLDLQKVAVAIILAEKKGTGPEEWTITQHDRITLLDDLISCMDNLTYQHVAELLTTLRAGNLLPLLNEGVQAYNEEKATCTQDTLPPEIWQQIGSLLSRRDYHHLRTTSTWQADILPSSREKCWVIRSTDIPADEQNAFYQYFEDMQAPALNIKIEGNISNELLHRLCIRLTKNRQLETLQLEVPIRGLTKINIAFLGALTSLTSLNISIPLESGRTGILELTDEEISPIANLTKLRLLNISNDCDIEDNGLRLAAKLTQLETLYMAGINLTAAGLAAHLPQLTQLKKLNISNNRQSGDPGLQTVAGLTQLEELMMAGTSLTTAGLRAHLPQLTHLKLLDISHNQQSGDQVLQTVAGLTQLEALMMANTDLTTAGLRAHLSQLTRLKLLNISNNKFGDQGLEIVAESTQLETLILRDIGLTTAGMTHLHQFTRLKKLDISGNRQLGVKGLELAAGLTQLETLGMGRTRLTLAGLRAHLSQFTHLKSLDIRGNGLSLEESKLLAKQYPDMQIQS